MQIQSSQKSVIDTNTKPLISGSILPLSLSRTATLEAFAVSTQRKDFYRAPKPLHSLFSKPYAIVATRAASLNPSRPKTPLQAEKSFLWSFLHTRYIPREPSSVTNRSQSSATLGALGLIDATKWIHSKLLLIVPIGVYRLKSASEA